MLKSSVPPATADSVGRIVEAVFRGAAYNGRGPRETLLGKLWEKVLTLLGDAFEALIRAIASIPGGITVVKLAFDVIALIVIGTIIYHIVSYVRGRRGRVSAIDEASIANLWDESQRAAQNGDYTQAAHLLYAALLHTFVARGLVRFHSSKTAGDYVRELRRTANSSALGTFAEFVGAYEVVIYRDGVCDARQYEVLRALAEPALRPARVAA